MDDMSLEVNLGSVSSYRGNLTFRFVVHSSGNAYLSIHAFDPSDLRKSGVLLSLDEDGYEQLKELIAKTERTIEKLQSAGQMNKMTLFG